MPTSRLVICLAALALLALAACDDAGSTSVLDAAPDAASDAAADVATDAEGPTCEANPPALPDLRLRIEGTLLLDALGRQVMLRGANTGGRSKLAPFVPFAMEAGDGPGDPAFDAAVAAYFQRMADWGHRVARMPFTWDALEPTRGTFDLAWLARYEAMVEAAAAHDIRVIVDFHQDVFARPYCGDGFPIWTLPEPVPERPEDCSTWFLGYLNDPKQKAAFDRLWANEDGILDGLKAMWTFMSAQLWEHDNVIGFEIINEPGNGNAEEETWAKDVLTPFYTEMGALIREQAPGALIFFDATGFDATVQTTAVERPTGEGFVFAPHFYDQAIFLFGQGDPEAAAALGNWAALGESWDVPVLVGEFGIQRKAEAVRTYSRAAWENLDAFGLHGTVWEYSDAPTEWNDEGMSLVDLAGQETAAAEEATRAFPVAVAGRIDGFEWDAESRRGSLRFQAVAGTSELSVPARRYPDGVSVTLQGPEGCARWEAESGRLYVTFSEAGAATVTFGPGG